MDKKLSSGPVSSILDSCRNENRTRVTFIPGVQALYAEALKNICYVKKIPLMIMMQKSPSRVNKKKEAQLYDLTSQTSLPTMLHDEERPRNVWIEQLALAEEIGAEDSPSLIPDNLELRVEMFGVCAVVLAEDGLVWNARILNDSPLARKYGYSEQASASALAKIAEIIRLMDGRLESQAKLGSPYLVGNTLTAADIYWATMCMIILPASPEDHVKN